MALSYNKLKIFTEQGKLVSLQQSFNKLPFFSKALFKNIFLNKKKILYLRNSSFRILSVYKNFIIFVYNGKEFKRVFYKSLGLLKYYGQFKATRIINSGKLLHLTKKNSKK